MLSSQQSEERRESSRSYRRLVDFLFLIFFGQMPLPFDGHEIHYFLRLMGTTVNDPFMDMMVNAVGTTVNDSHTTLALKYSGN